MAFVMHAPAAAAGPDVVQMNNPNWIYCYYKV